MGKKFYNQIKQISVIFLLNLPDELGSGRGYSLIIAPSFNQILFDDEQQTNF